MLARLLRPEPRGGAALASRLLLLAVSAAALALLPTAAWRSADWCLGLVIALIPALSTRRPAAALACLPPVLIAGAAAVHLGGPAAGPMAGTALLLLPGAIGIGQAASTAARLRALDLGVEAALPLSQLVLLAALLLPHQAVLAVLAGIPALLLLPASLAAPGDGWTAEPGYRTALPPLPEPLPRREPPILRGRGPFARFLPSWLDPQLVALVAALLLYLVQSSDRHLPDLLHGRTGWALLLSGVVWVVATGMPELVLLPLGMLVGLVLVLREFHLPDAAAPPLLPLVEAAPLLWWWNRSWALGHPLLTQAGLATLAMILAIASPPLPTPTAWPLLLLAMALVGLLAARLMAQRLTASEPAAATLDGMLAQASPWLPVSWRTYLWCKLRLDPLYQRLLQDDRPWGEVLDLGCGCGLAALVARCHQAPGYLGIDLDLKKLALARTLLTRSGRPLDGSWRLMHGHLPFPQPIPGRFTTILLLDVLHYWPPGQQQALLRFARLAALEPAELILRVASADQQGRAGLVGRGERLTSGIGLNPRSGSLCFLGAEAMQAQLAASGWTVTAVEPCGGENLLWRCRAGVPAAAAPGPQPEPLQDPGHVS